MNLYFLNRFLKLIGKNYRRIILILLRRSSRRKLLFKKSWREEWGRLFLRGELRREIKGLSLSVFRGILGLCTWSLSLIATIKSLLKLSLSAVIWMDAVRLDRDSWLWRWKSTMTSVVRNRLREWWRTQGVKFFSWWQISVWFLSSRIIGTCNCSRGKWTWW